MVMMMIMMTVAKRIEGGKHNTEVKGAWSGADDDYDADGDDDYENNDDETDDVDDANGENNWRGYQC